MFDSIMISIYFDQENMIFIIILINQEKI